MKPIEGDSQNNVLEAFFAIEADITLGMRQLQEQIWHRAVLAVAPPFVRERFSSRDHLDAIFTYRLFVTPASFREK